MYAQDAWAIHISLGGQPNLFLGVFDGHGADGTKISSLVARTVPRLLAHDTKFKVTTSFARGAVEKVKQEQSRQSMRFTGMWFV
jgi:serine/threonine protein phosphatase PrpC